MSKQFAAAVLFAALVISCGGGASDSASLCAPGATQICIGPGACQGAQVCSKDGAGWGICDCGSSNSVDGSNSQGGSASVSTSATTGGSNTAGGSSSSSTAAVCKDAVASGTAPLIDDLTDGNEWILTNEGRLGTWYVYNDGTGSQVPALNTPTLPTDGRMCTSGDGFTSWGAGLGLSIDADASKNCNYDVTAYTGIRFKLEGSTTNSFVRFVLVTNNIASPIGGGSCDKSLNNCDDFYGADIVATTSGIVCENKTSAFSCVSTATNDNSLLISIPFARMSQMGWGTAFSVFDLAHTLGMHWEIHLSDTLAASFEFCIDNITFY